MPGRRRSRCWAASLLVGRLNGGPRAVLVVDESLLLVLYLLATASIAGVLGFIFAVPRARAENGEGAVRFLSNSNLEQIWDRLTQILVGAPGVCAAGHAPRPPEPTWATISAAIYSSPNGPTASVAVTVYGAGVGFVFVYLWTRLRFRVGAPEDERAPGRRGRRARRPSSSTSSARGGDEAGPGRIERGDRTGPPPTSPRSRCATRTSSVGKRVLWVDDNPSNNIAERRVLEAIGIMVEEARSTADVIEMLKSRHFDLVITDLGRTEGATRQPEAGVKLIEQIKRLQLDIPVFIYGTQDAYRRRNDLMQKGAADVFTRPTELTERVANELARR